MELLLKSGKTLVVHAHRLKPYFLPTKSNVTFKEYERIEIEKEDITYVPTQTDDQENDEEKEHLKDLLHPLHQLKCHALHTPICRSSIRINHNVRKRTE